MALIDLKNVEKTYNTTAVPVKALKKCQSIHRKERIYCYRRPFRVRENHFAEYYRRFGQSDRWHRNY